MPIYPVKCSAGHKSDVYAKVEGRNRIRCACGARATLDWTRISVANGDPAWTGQRSESITMAFQESGIPSIKRDCPSMEFTRDKNQPGVVKPVFRSDKHHRKCLKEMARAREKYAAGA